MPPLEPVFTDAPTHRTACHFPVPEGEDISQCTPGIDQSSTGPLVGADLSAFATGS